MQYVLFLYLQIHSELHHTIIITVQCNCTDVSGQTVLHIVNYGLLVISHTTVSVQLLAESAEFPTGPSPLSLDADSSLSSTSSMA